MIIIITHNPVPDLYVCEILGVEMEQSDPSPLKRFVQAKKKIGEVFEQLLVYVQEGTEFVKGKLNMIWIYRLILEVCRTVVSSIALFACVVSVSSETCNNESLENITDKTQLDQIEAYTSKLSTIKEVLARRHMKVAFFGRWVLCSTTSCIK